MGLPKGPEGQGLPEVRTSVPDTLGLLGREGQARGGGQGPAWEAAGTLCGCSDVSAPRRALGTLEGQLTDWSPGVQGCSDLLGANLKIPGSSGDRGNGPCPAATSHITRSPGVLSRAVWKPLTLRNWLPEAKTAALRSLSSHETFRGTVLVPGVQRAVTLELTTPSAGVQVASLSFPFVGKE